jgi:TusA-related sulfurtransferase
LILILIITQQDIVLNIKTSPCKVPVILILILIITQQDIVLNVKTSPCKVPVILDSYSNNNSARYCLKR